MLKEKANKGISYATYRELTATLVEEGKTTGPNQAANLVEFTALNQHRMKRIDKTVKLNPELEARMKAIDRPQVWLVLTEAWCGDAAQNIPVLAAVANAAPNVQLRLVLRDENLDLMDAYLTNGGRSIPKLIAFDAETGEELGTWGPRPATAQQMVMDYKADPNKPPYEEFTKGLHLWYARDKGASVQAELLASSFVKAAAPTT